MRNIQKKMQAMESAFDVCTEDLFNQVALLNLSNANFPAGAQYFTKLSFIFILCLKCLIRIFNTKSSFQVESIFSLLLIPCQSFKFQNCAICALRMIVQYLMKNWKLCKIVHYVPSDSEAWGDGEEGG